MITEEVSAAEARAYAMKLLEDNYSLDVKDLSKAQIMDLMNLLQFVLRTKPG